MSELIRTCVTLTPRHKTYIEENSLSVSKLLHSVLDKKIQDSEKPNQSSSDAQ